MHVTSFVLLVLVGGVFSVQKSSDPDKKLRLVHVIFRHGARTPVIPYPKDKYFNNTYYPYGMGQLTNIGKMEQYELGQYLRQKYDSFLGDMYFDGLVIARSTLVPRTFMSCAITLAGLWPPRGTPLDWNPNLNWSPIPIFFDPFLTDAVTEGFDTCAKYSKEYLRVQTGPEGKKLFDENEQMIDELTEITGLRITKFIEALLLYNTFKSQEKLGLELSERIIKVIPKLKRFLESSFEFRTRNNLLKRLKMGRFVNQMVNYWKAKSNGTISPENVKMFLYGVHEITVADFLSAIGVRRRHVPEFSEAVILELYEDIKTNKYAVKISSKVPSEVAEKPLVIKGCKKFCPLEKIIELTRNVVLEDIEKKCEI